MRYQHYLDSQCGRSLLGLFTATQEGAANIYNIGGALFRGK